jgi:transketolase
MEELTVIVDHNKLQSDTTVKNVSDLGNLEAKFAAFGWHVSRCNGNDVNDFSKVLNENRFVQNLPKVIIADTIKGKGVSFMEHTSIDSDVEFYKFHSGAPSNDAYLKALQELIILVNNDI